MKKHPTDYVSWRIIFFIWLIGVLLQIYAYIFGS